MPLVLCGIFAADQVRYTICKLSKALSIVCHHAMHIEFQSEFTRNKASIRPFLIFASRWLAPHFVLARPRSGVGHGKFLI